MGSLGGDSPGRKRAKGTPGAFPGRPADAKAPKRVKRTKDTVVGQSLGAGPARAGGKPKRKGCFATVILMLGGLAGVTWGAVEGVRAIVS